MGAIETKRLKQSVAELEATNRKMLTDLQVMQHRIELVRDHRDKLLKAVGALLERFDIFIESDWCDEIDQEAYDSARSLAAEILGNKP
jgi:hypothetical protein